MGDRTDEATATEPRSTEDLLEETERLLSESSADVGGGSDSAPRDAGTGEPGTDVEPETDAEPTPTDDSAWWRSDDTGESDPDEDDDSSTGSRWGRLRPSLSGWLRPSVPALSPSAYFSPRAFVALTAVFGAGFLGGGMTIPVAGQLIGMFAAGFLVGLATSKRRYLEVGLAGSSVGAVTGLFNYAVVVAAGLGGRVLVAGVTAGALACLLGYYFGRDLRNGLNQEV